MELESKTKPSPAYKSISQAANILVCLSHNVNKLTEIAVDCKITKPTAHRLLKALERANLVMQDSLNHQYYLGSLLYEISSDISSKHQQLLLNSIEEIKGLAKYTEETVALGVMDGLKFSKLYEIPSNHDLKITESLTNVNLVDITSPPTPMKVTLAQLDDKTLQQLFRKVNNHQSDIEAILLPQLRLVRQQGYCVSYSQTVVGGACVSVPIHNYYSPVVLSVLGPEVRMKNREASILQEATATASRISQKIADKFVK
jgi:IclR family acetate operon transcriptional repressor